jgi:fructose transport system substrate-binding protein
MLAACSGSSATQAPASGEAPAGDQIIVGLITKTETNPFFVKMKEGAQAKADELGIKLLTGAGAKDGDNAGQVTALENMVNAGAKGILITPSDTKAIVPSIQMPATRASWSSRSTRPPTRSPRSTPCSPPTTSTPAS